MNFIDQAAMLVALCAFSFLGVASRSYAKGDKVWTRLNLSYALLAALLTVLLLHLLGINP